MNSKILPTGWSIRTIGDLVRLSSGRQIDYSHVDDFPFPVYGANGILGWCSRLNVEDVILIGRVGASGSVHYVKGKAWANDNTLVLDEFKELDERFLYYWLVNHDLPKLATQTAQPLITQTTLKNIVIYNPPLNEQNRIGEILGNVNHTITQTEQLIEKLRAIKRGLLHDLLTRGIGEDGRVRDLSAIESDDQNWVVYQSSGSDPIVLMREPENEAEVNALLWKLETLRALPFAKFQTLAYIGAARGPDLLVNFQEEKDHEPNRKSVG